MTATKITNAITLPDGTEAVTRNTRAFTHAVVIRYTTGRWIVDARCGSLALAQKKVAWLEGCDAEFNGWAEIRIVTVEQRG